VRKFVSFSKTECQEAGGTYSSPLRFHIASVQRLPVLLKCSTVDRRKIPVLRIDTIRKSAGLRDTAYNDWLPTSGMVRHRPDEALALARPICLGARRLCLRA